MHAVVEGAGGEQFAIGTESDAVDWFRVPAKDAKAAAALGVPQTHGGVEACARQDQLAIGVGRIRAGWAPLDRVDLFVMALTTVQIVSPVHSPQLQCLVVRTRGQ